VEEKNDTSLQQPATRKDLMDMMEMVSNGFTVMHDELVSMRHDIGKLSSDVTTMKQDITTIKGKLFEHDLRLGRIELRLGIPVGTS
jgi:hypothetical protein